METRVRASLLAVMLSTSALAPAIAPTEGGHTEPAGSYSKVTIYYLGWDIETRTRLSPVDVRRMSPLVVTLTDSARVQRFWQWLEVPAAPTTAGSAAPS